jgi:hypothetical protein
MRRSGATAIVVLLILSVFCIAESEEYDYIARGDPEYYQEYPATAVKRHILLAKRHLLLAKRADQRAQKHQSRSLIEPITY